MRAVVVVPTYEEAGNVERLVPLLLSLPERPDVLVVDDSSRDGTPGLVLALADAHPGRVHLHSRPVKDGLGRAYVAGFAWALQRGYDQVVQMDADFSHDPADVSRLLGRLQGADLVLGSRYVPGGSAPDWPLRRRLLSRGGNLYARLVLAAPVADLTGGFKAWRAPLLSSVPWDGVEASGYLFQIETTLAALDLGAEVVSVPIVFRDRTVGTSKMHGSIVKEAALGVWRLRRARRSRRGPFSRSR